MRETISKNRNKLKAGGVFLACLLVSVFLLQFVNNYYIHKRKANARNVGESVGSSIISYLYDGVYCVDILDILCRDGEPDMDKIDLVADNFLKDSDDIIELVTVYKNGSVLSTYPKERYSQYLENLFEEKGPLHDVAAYAGRNKRKVISNSFRLLSGETVFAIIQPIYDVSASSDGEDIAPSGFAMALLNADRIMKLSGVEKLKDQGYNYRIYKVNPATSIKENLSSFGEHYLYDPLMINWETPGGEYWHLLVSLNGGWTSTAERATFIFILLLISFLISLALYLIIKLKSSEEELKALSYSDSLTNVRNTRAYTDALEELKESKEEYGIIFIDVNDFKQINDTYGHRTGDEILSITAKRIGNSIREADELFRIGGDEFAVIIHGGHEGIFYEEIMARMKSAMNRKIAAHESVLEVSISCGFARYPVDGADYQAVVQAADKEMYRDKAEFKKKQEEDPSLRSG